MKKIAAIVFVVLLVSVGAGMYSLRFILDEAESRAAAALQKKGWTFSLPEKAELRFFALSPTIRYENVGLRSGENTVEIGELQVKLAWLPLFQKQIVVKKALMTEARIAYAGHEGAIRLLKLRKKSSETTVRGFFSVHGQPFDLRGGWQAGQFGFDVNGDGLFARLDGTENKGNIKASLKLSATKIPVARASDLAFAAQIAGTADKWDVPAFTLNWGGEGNTLLKAQGGYVDRALTAVFSGTLPDVAAVPLNYNGEIRTDKAGNFTEEVALSGGKTSVKATVRQTNDAFDVAVSSPMADLSELLPVKGGFVPPVLPRKTALSDLKDKQVKLSVSIGKLIGANGQHLGAVDLKAHQSNGDMQVSSFKIGTFASGTAAVSGREAASASLRLRLNAFPVAAFGDKNGITSGTVDGIVALKAQGVARSDLKSALNGKIRLTARDWRIEPTSQQKMPKFVEAALSDFNRPMTVSCAVINVPVQNGVLTSNRQIALESDVLNLQLNGTANFRGNALDMKVALAPKQGGIVPALLSDATIEGTFDAPVFKLNADSSLQRAVSYGLAFLQGGKAAARQAVQPRGNLKNVCKTAQGKRAK